MSLLERLREVERSRPLALPPAEADRTEPSPFAGVAVISPGTLDAMSRLLSRELPTFNARVAAARAEQVTAELARTPAVVAELPLRRVPLPRRTGHQPPQPAPPTDSTPPVAARSCPNCGGGTSVTRLDLTNEVGWFECRDCGLRFGGSIATARGNAEALGER